MLLPGPVVSGGQSVASAYRSEVLGVWGLSGGERSV